MRKLCGSWILGVMCALVCGWSFAGGLHRTEVPKWESGYSVSALSAYGHDVSALVAREAPRIREIPAGDTLLTMTRTSLQSGYVTVGNHFEASSEVGAGCIRTSAQTA